MEAQMTAVPEEGTVDGGALAAIRRPIDRHRFTSWLPDTASLVPEIGCSLVDPDDLVTPPQVFRHLPAPLGLFFQKIGPLLGTEELALRLGPGDAVATVPPPQGLLPDADIKFMSDEVASLGQVEVGPAPQHVGICDVIYELWGHL